MYSIFNVVVKLLRLSIFSLSCCEVVLLLKKKKFDSALNIVYMLWWARMDCIHVIRALHIGCMNVARDAILSGLFLYLITHNVSTSISPVHLISTICWCFNGCNVMPVAAVLEQVCQSVGVLPHASLLKTFWLVLIDLDHYVLNSTSPMCCGFFDTHVSTTITTTITHTQWCRSLSLLLGAPWRSTHTC